MSSNNYSPVVGRATKSRRDSFDDPTLPSGAVLRRFALFVDGMSRAMIIPFGPSLVYRLVNGAAEVTPSSWSSISLRLGLVIASFMVGHSVGALAAEKMSFSNHMLHRYVARLGGAAISLHIFTCGAGLNSVFWLMTIRFFSAAVAGILCGITNALSLPEDLTMDNIAERNASPSPEKQEQQQKQSTSIDPRSDIASGTAKIYLTGFSFSILSGGLLYRPASTHETFQALTGSYGYSLSALSLIAMTIIGEIALRGAFSLTTQPEHLDQSRGTIRKVKKFVRRIVGGLRSQGQQRVSFKEDRVDPESLRLIGSVDPLRPRSSSAASALTDMDEFYDCQSQLSDGISTSKPIHNDFDEDDVALYRDGKCCYADGTPAYVPQGDVATIVPSNYLEDCKGDREKAMRRWQETQKWRREQNVWRIHKIPNEFFYEIKKAYPHFAHGYTKAGYPVMYEQPGKMDLKSLFRGECTIDDMVHHYIFFQEFLSHCLCASTEIRKIARKESEPYHSSCYGLIVVMDIKGAGVSMVSGDVLRYLKRVGDINGAHYPLSMKKVCVVNAPFWASGVFATIKRVLPESVTIDLIPENDCVQGLQKYIEIDQIPPEYGGRSPYKLGQHPYETKLCDLVDAAAFGDIETNGPSMIVSSTPGDMVDINLDYDGGEAEPQNEMSTRSVNDPMDRDKHNVRRRAAAGAATPVPSAQRKSAVYALQEVKVGVDSLAFVSFFCAFRSGAQGGVEVAIPLWLSSPVTFGGLGYSPSTSGVAIFCVALVLFSMLTTRASRLVSTMPRTDPLRALRMGLGAESVILFILAFVPINLSPNDTIIFLSTVVLLSFGTFASILGRASSATLRALVNDGLSKQTMSTIGAPTSVFSVEYLITECTRARSAELLSVIGSVTGVLVNSEIWSLSVNRERPSQYDGSLCLFLPAFLTAGLYFGSYFLRVNADDKYLAQQSSSRTVELAGTFSDSGRKGV